MNLTVRAWRSLDLVVQFVLAWFLSQLTMKCGSGSKRNSTGAQYRDWSLRYSSR
ncbi:hypothetical protein KZZ08_10310 [Roseovarius mucosus]|uniref:hypothetical protein n=1 Tax=Roseovarius mucosus TaxID=215743 RepID=UPI001C5FECDF|nr:hypothetical protein [Roseovarius mucosus]MBW4974014.1 hypothetical protein [Roseovarius mucosus]